jgi:hypothetical protein
VLGTAVGGANTLGAAANATAHAAVAWLIALSIHGPRAASW